MPNRRNRIGIVGSEAAKFSPEAEAAARALIRELARGRKAVVSGACHLGGIDLWAAEEGRALGVGVIEFAPKVLNWSAPGGYKDRNLLIATNSDELVCITVASLPETYRGMTFEKCYHCGTDKHVKSGGCWTVKQGVRMGKPGRWYVVIQEGEVQ